MRSPVMQPWRITSAATSGSMASSAASALLWTCGCTVPCGLLVGFGVLARAFGHDSAPRTRVSVLPC